MLGRVHLPPKFQQTSGNVVRCTCPLPKPLLRMPYSYAPSCGIPCQVLFPGTSYMPDTFAHCNPQSWFPASRYAVKEAVQPLPLGVLFLEGWRIVLCCPEWHPVLFPFSEGLLLCAQLGQEDSWKR